MSNEHYEQMVAKSKEIGWPNCFQDDLHVHDKRQVEDLPTHCPALWFVRETGTWCATANGLGFPKHEGEGLMRHLTKPHATEHRGFLVYGDKIIEISRPNFQRTYSEFILRNNLPKCKVVVTAKWRPAPWSSEQIESHTYQVAWCGSHDDLRSYVYCRLDSYKEHTIQIFSEVKQQEAVA